MTMDEMKRQYQALQEEIRKLEADRAWFLERGGPAPWRIGFRLELLRIEAEELRMWGNRELTCQLRQAN